MSVIQPKNKQIYNAKSRIGSDNEGESRAQSRREKGSKTPRSTRSKTPRKMSQESLKDGKSILSHFVLLRQLSLIFLFLFLIYLEIEIIVSRVNITWVCDYATFLLKSDYFAFLKPCGGLNLNHVVLDEMFWNLKTWIREPFNREIGERESMSDSPPGKVGKGSASPNYISLLNPFNLP